MSAFGGDSWAREAQYRKRKVDELMLPSSSGGDSSSFRKLSNGQYVCLVCPNSPILDTTLMLSMHNKGTRHVAAESRLRVRESWRQDELNKRISLQHDLTGPSSGCLTSKIKCIEYQDKPLIQQSRKAILETKHNQIPNVLDASQNTKLKTGSSSYRTEFPIVTDSIREQNKNFDVQSNNVEIKVSAMSESRVPVDWQRELHDRREKELKFTSAGWKRDCHGKWYRDENVEFDSDEEDPNICLS